MSIYIGNKEVLDFHIGKRVVAAAYKGIRLFYNSFSKIWRDKGIWKDNAIWRT